LRSSSRDRLLARQISAGLGVCHALAGFAREGVCVHGWGFVKLLRVLETRNAMKMMGMATISLMLLGIAGFAGVPVGEAADYLGQLCWQGTAGEVLKMAVTHMGDGHFLLNGAGTTPNGNFDVFIGSAEVSGSSVYMTTTSAGSSSSYTWGFIGRFVLNLSTLSGSGEIMGVSHSKTDPNPGNTSLDYDGPITLTLIPCP